MSINPNVRLAFIILLLMISSCNGFRNGMYGHESFSNLINDPIVMDYSHPSPNYNERPSGISPKIIVAHYTVGDFKSALHTLTDSSPVGHGPVSAHYLVPKTAIDGQRKVFGLVPEDKRAWHAGVGQWGAYGDVNDASIGIEIVNSGYQELEDRRAWDSFPDYQIDTLISFMQPIVERYRITPTNVIGHADLAPGRKQDPGPLFPWEEFHKNGIGAWYNRSELDIKEQGGVDIEQLQRNLKTYGYPVKQFSGVLDEDTRNLLISFQMHFRPNPCSGDVDAETAAIAKNLVEKYCND